MPRESKQRVQFEGLFNKLVSVEFEHPSQTSDGGVILLRALDERMGLTRRMAEAIHDDRQSGKLEHPMHEMMRERVYGIACGYPECNETARLSRDPAMKLACQREKHQQDDGSSGCERPLASQPTLSRFENAPRRSDLLKAAYALTDTVIQEQRARRRGRKVGRIVIDMDPTDDPTYGGQQLTFFNGHYDTWCYLPMITTLQFDQQTDQFLVAPVLRPGNAKGTLGAISVLKRLVPRLRKAFPQAQVYVRMDGAFAPPAVFLWLEQHDREEKMSTKKGKRGERSASKEPENKKLEIEVVFGSSETSKSDEASAKSAGEDAKPGKEEPPRRLIFRF